MVEAIGLGHIEEGALAMVDAIFQIDDGKKGGFHECRVDGAERSRGPSLLGARLRTCC